MTKTLLAALAASTVLAGVAFAADTPASTSNIGTMTTSAKPAKPMTPVAPAVPFKGQAASFKAGTDDKSANVSNKTGDWFTVNFSSTCKALDTAKTVKLSQTKSTGYLWSGKSKCKVASFEKVAATTTPAATTPANPH